MRVGVGFAREGGGWGLWRRVVVGGVSIDQPVLFLLLALLLLLTSSYQIRQMAALCLQLIIPEVWVLNGSFAPRCFPLHNLKLNFASPPPAAHTNASTNSNNNTTSQRSGHDLLRKQAEVRWCMCFCFVWLVAWLWEGRERLG